jgi:hypothetical protein
MESVMILVDDGADRSDRSPTSAREEELVFGVFVERILHPIEKRHPLFDQRGNPIRITPVKLERECDQRFDAFPISHRFDMDLVHALYPASLVGLSGQLRRVSIRRNAERI